MLSNVVCRVCLSWRDPLTLLFFSTAASYREYVLMSKDLESEPQEHSHATFFDGPEQAITVPKSNFSGQFQGDFIVRLSMKHSNDGGEEKEHIFCSSDDKGKSR